MSTGMIIDGVLGSEAIDSSGEVLDVAGADISDVDNGTCALNWEHQPGEKGASTIVGIVLKAKKIFKRDDCDSERQRKYWDEVRLPFIYGIARLYDGAGHEEAKRIAAIIRDHVANGEPILCRYSVEGATLDKKDNRLKESVVRRVAVTVKPCNRTAVSGLIEDPNAPEGFEKLHVTKAKARDLLEFEDVDKSESDDPMLHRLGHASVFECNPMVDDALAKTLDAGTTAAAPGALTGGAALQREDLGPRKKKMMDVIATYKAERFNRVEFRDFAKMQMPEASDEFLDHFADLAEDYHVKRAQLTKKEPEFEEPFDFAQSVVAIDRLSVQLRKMAEDFQVSQFADPTVPTVYKLYYKADGVNGEEFLAGRFMLHDNKVQHLEDYHGLLEDLLPEGPLNAAKIAQINSLKQSAHIHIAHDNGPEPEQRVKEPEAPKPVQGPRPQSVFSYKRAGHDAEHTLEVHNGHHLLDGEMLSDSEVQTILNNHRSGAATIRYKSGGANPVQQIAKMEAEFEALAKGEFDLKPHALVQHIRDAEARGHMPAGSGDAATKHFFEDPMTPGIGNKVALQDHLEQQPNRPGVYVQMDGNDFSKINNAFGHAAGDGAIKAFGNAAREASEEATPGVGKLFRNGGDEFVAHFPSHEHAAAFSRALSQKLEKMPPVGGAHRLSMSFGFGPDMHTADKALYEAKKQKVLDPPAGTGLWSRIGKKLGIGQGVKRKFPVGQVPNLAHSLMPGHEGPLPMHNEGASAVHSTLHSMGAMKPAVTKPAAPAAAPKSAAA